MDNSIIKNLCDRTDAKLRYAAIYIDELRKLGTNGNDIDRAHQESFLFHLWGAKDAFLIELNLYYGVNLPIKEVSSGILKKELDKRGKVSNELIELFTLENDNSTWLFNSKEMQDSSTHRTAVSRTFHLGGEFDNQVFLRNPKTGQNIERHFVDEFADWALNMKELLERLRESALRQNNITMT